MTTPGKCMATLGQGIQEVFGFIIWLLFDLIKSASVLCRSQWKYRFIFSFFFLLFFHSTVHCPWVRGNHFIFFPLDELLLIGNYLYTIDGTLVNNWAMAVHNMKERDKERKGEVRQTIDLPPQHIHTGQTILLVWCPQILKNTSKLLRKRVS